MHISNELVCIRVRSTTTLTTKKQEIKMDITKVLVGTLVLTKVKVIRKTYECAAWFLDVEIQPGTYNLNAYISWSDGRQRIHNISAECDGVSTAGDFTPLWCGNAVGKNRYVAGQKETAFIDIACSGMVHEKREIVQPYTFTLNERAIVRTEWETDGRYSNPPGIKEVMWRYEWKRDCKLVYAERARYQSGNHIAAIEGAI